MTDKSEGMNITGWAALWFAVVIWGGSFLATQLLIAEITPLVAALMRFVIASTVLLSVAFIRAGKVMTPARSDWSGVLTYGFLGVTLCFAFENVALKLTSSGNASVIIGLIPVGTLIAARHFLGEKMTTRQWIGATIATGGSLWLVLAGQALSLSNPRGDSLMVLAMLSSVVAGLVGKKTSGRLDPILNVGYSFAVGAIMLIPLALGEWFWHPYQIHLSAQAWLALLYLALFASGIGYTAYFYALSKTTLSAATLPSYLVPVVTLLLASWLHNEPLTLSRGLAALVVILGLILSNPPALTPVQALAKD